MKYLIVTLSLFASVLVLTGCANQPPPSSSYAAPGFFYGLFHGIIAPFSFIVSLFVDNIRMYAWPNSGRWYDFGFVIGIFAWAGGGAAST